MRRSLHRILNNLSESVGGRTCKSGLSTSRGALLELYIYFTWLHHGNEEKSESNIWKGFVQSSGKIK